MNINPKDGGTVNERPVTQRLNRAGRAAKLHGDLACWFVTFTLLFVMCVLHFWKLNAIPKGFSLDEASEAYNAYCIAQTGADEYGTSYPMFFQAFGTYHDPAIVYALAPFMNVFGLRQDAARIPSALFSVLAALAFGLLAYEYCRNRWLALLGVASFSTAPWIFPISRTVSSYIPMLFGLVCGWWLLLLAFRKRRCWLGVAAGLSWALAMYSDNVGRPMTVIWLVCFGLAFNRLLLARWKVGLTFALSYVGAMVPMILSVMRFPGQLTARFRMVSAFQGQLGAAQILKGLAVRYLDYFSPQFLFFTGDHELRHHTGFGGELSLFIIPLILVGILHVLRFWRTQPHYRFLALALLVYPAAAALTIDRMHSIRCSNGVIAWLLLATVGARALWRLKRVGRKLLVVICAAGFIEGGAYFTDYFGPYQTRCRKEFQTGFTEAIAYCFDRIDSHRVYYVSGSVGTTCSVSLDTDFKPFVYAYLLFYGRIDPRVYQHGGFSNTVVRPYLEEIDQPGLLLRCNYRPETQGTKFLAITNLESVPDRAKLLAIFRDDPLEYQVFEVTP